MKKLSLLAGLLLCSTVSFSAGWGAKLLNNVANVGSVLQGKKTETATETASIKEIDNEEPERNADGIIVVKPSHRLPNPSTQDPRDSMREQMESICTEMLLGKEVNTSISYQQYILSLQKMAKDDNLVVKQGGTQNQAFNALAIKALERDSKFFKEIKDFDVFFGDTECYKNLKSLYDVMHNTKEQLCRFIVQSETRGKEKWCYQPQKDYCSCSANHTPKELKNIFVTVDESFETKWSFDPDKRGPMLPSENIKPNKKTIFDEVHKLFLK